MALLRLLSFFVVLAIHSCLADSKCRITKDSGDNPYLVRIFECIEVNPDWPLTNLTRCFDNKTVAHGALVSADKVFTTCSWVTGDTANEVFFRLYNTKDKCVQERDDFRVITHRACREGLVHGEDFNIFDMALWIVNQPFDVAIEATVWKGKWGGINPPPFDDMRKFLEALYDDGHVTECNAVMFSNASAVDEVVEPDKNIEWIPWKKCLELIEKVFTIDDPPDDKPLRKIGNTALICVRDKKIANFRFNPPQEIGADWRSGAAVFCTKDGKKFPVGITSRIIAPAPWAKIPAFRVGMAFHAGFYDFLTDTMGISPTEEKTKDEIKCKISGDNNYPYLLRLAKKAEGFEPLVTVGHGALINPLMAMSSCTPFRHLPEDMSKDKKWEMIGYNPSHYCTARRKPIRVFKHKDCKNYDPEYVMANDFAMWMPDRRFEFDPRRHYPNLWQGPMMPPLKEVVRSILELSDSDYLGVISRRLAVGIFLDKHVVTEDRLVNAQAEFVPWEKCQIMLKDRVSNTNEIRQEFVVDKATYPVFCAHSRFRFKPYSNVSLADWYSGAVAMYSFLYVWQFGDEPSTVTYPIGVFSRVVTIETADGEQTDIRVISGLSKSYYEFMASSEHKITKIIAKGGQPPGFPLSSQGALAFPLLTIMLTST